MSVAVKLQSSFDRANTYPGKRMRPTTQKQASRRAEIAARRYDALQLKIAGYSDRQIASRLGVGVSTAHNDVKNVLETLAREHVEEAANLRALLNIRYEELFHAYHDQAIAGDTEAKKIVVGIMERVAKINGVIPDRSLVTVDQRSVHLVDGEVTFNIEAASGNMAKMMYGAGRDEVSNGGDYVKA
jgi:DNA-binding CsgD family transcriptional regulator